MFGAPKKCAKCDKQVYSIEELKCLDKVWHKGCFKCTVCNTTLNLKNYKGVDKLPYCSVHYPKQTYTAVSDNPELLRIKENTKIQSNAKYHADYEKSKGNFTVVADDPEMRRVLENTKNISNIKYHEDFEKKRNKYTPIVNKSTQNIQANPTIIASYRSGENTLVEPIYKSQQQRRIGSIADYDPLDQTKQNSYENNNAFSQQYHAMQNQLNQQKQMLQQKQLQAQQQEKMNQNYTSNSRQNLNNSRNEYIEDNIYNQKANNGYPTTNSIANSMNNSINHYYQANENVQTSVFRAIYDYDAKEDDEISFRDGDKFINCEQIDVGWMIGVHEKTGKHGMIPFNYAEPIDLF